VHITGIFSVANVLLMFKNKSVALISHRQRQRVSLLFTAYTIALIAGCGAVDVAQGSPPGTAETSTAHTLTAAPASSNRVNAEVVAVYVDASRGADTNPGTAHAPWKTLARLGGAHMAQGQHIRLHCASTWRETLKLGAAQLADNVTIEPYGEACNGQRPRILGSDDFSRGWVREGMLWWRAVPANTPKIARLFVNGEPMQLARWPNAEATPDHAETDPTAVSTSLRQFSVAPPHLKTLAPLDLTDATVQIRSADWRIDTLTVLAYAPATGSMTLAANTAYPIPAGTDFVLQDKAWMLDAPGEYFHDLQRQRIYLYPPTALQQTGPNGAQVEGSVRDNGLLLNGHANLTLSGLNIENSRQIGLTLQNTANARVSDIQLHNNSAIGMRITSAASPASTTANPSVTLQDSQISGSSLYGVDAGNAAHARFINNRFTDIGTRSDAGNSYAALLIGPASVAEANQISNVAYIGIRFNGSGGSQVRNNVIEGFCARLGDCAAIYTWNGPKGKSNLIDQHALIEGNTLLGTALRAAHTTLKSGWITAGIYLDDYSSGVTVRNNVVGHAPLGIYVHNGSNHTIESNKVWLTTRAAIWANMDQTDADYMTGNRFMNNELVPVALVQGQWPAPPILQTSQAIWYWQKRSDYNSFVAGGSNQFSGNRVVLLNESTGQHMRVRGAGFDTYLDTEEWRRINPGETTASTPARYTPYVLSLGPEQLRGGTFDSGWSGWGHWLNPQGTGGYAKPVAHAPGCTGGCITFASATPNDLINSPSFNLKAGHPYRIAMDAMFPAGGAIAMPYVSSNGPPWESFATPGSFTNLTRTQAATGQKIAYESVFQASVSSEARLSLKLATQNAVTNIDNVSLREILAYSVYPSHEFATIVMQPASGTRAPGKTTLVLKQQ
jgi:parallel beta-helix repeat protein